MSPVVGFVGLGHMGRPMARNLAAAGFDMVVFDLNRSGNIKRIVLGETVGSIVSSGG